MERVGTNVAADWLAAQGWTAPAFGESRSVRITSGAGLVRYCVKIDADSAPVGCAMAATFLHDVVPATFAGGLLWVTGTFPPDDDNLRFAHHVIRGCGADVANAPIPWFLRLDPGEFDACFSMLSLALMFGWNACLVMAGRRLLVEADNDALPSLVTGEVSAWLDAALANCEAERTPWPFRSRFVSA